MISFLYSSSVYACYFLMRLMVTSSKRALPHLLGRSRAPALGQATAYLYPPQVDTQRLKGRSGSVPVGSPVYKVLFEPSERLWWIWGLILNAISLPATTCWGFAFALGCRVSFLVGSNILLLMVLQQWVVILVVSSQEKITPTLSSWFSSGEYSLEEYWQPPYLNLWNNFLSLASKLNSENSVLPAVEEQLNNLMRCSNKRNKPSAAAGIGALYKLEEFYPPSSSTRPELSATTVTDLGNTIVFSCASSEIPGSLPLYTASL